MITGRGSSYTYKTLKSKIIRLIYFIAFSLIKLKKDYLVIFQNSHDKNLFLNNYALSEDKTRIKETVCYAAMQVPVTAYFQTKA